MNMFLKCWKTKIYCDNNYVNLFAFVQMAAGSFPYESVCTIFIIFLLYRYFYIAVTLNSVTLCICTLKFFHY